MSSDSHHVDLKADAGGPRAELLGRDARMEENRAFRTRSGLGEHLRRQDAEREAEVDELRGQRVGGGSAAVHDRPEPDLAGVVDSVRELGERAAAVEVGRMNSVPGGSKLVGEPDDPGRQAEGVMEGENLGHQVDSSMNADTSWIWVVVSTPL
jgi:hypothetical protein